MNIRADQIWTTPLNDLDAVQRGFDRGKTVRFYDTTLRDGEQSTGVCFSANDKFEIACKLAELGVGRIESGFPRVSEEDTEAVRRILGANLGSEIWGFARCLQADIDAHIRNTSITVHHPLGTCKMGLDNDPSAVVDPELRVRGLDGLRAVDASVMPDMVTGNINAAVVMVAERAADLILRG